MCFPRRSRWGARRAGRATHQGRLIRRPRNPCRNRSSTRSSPQFDSSLCAPGRSAVPTPGVAASRAPRRRTRLRSASGSPRVSGESGQKPRGRRRARLGSWRRLPDAQGSMSEWSRMGGSRGPHGPDPPVLVRASWPPQQLRGVSRARSRGYRSRSRAGGPRGAVGRLDNLPLRAQSPPHQTQREVLIWARSSIATRSTPPPTASM